MRNDYNDLINFKFIKNGICDYEYINVCCYCTSKQLINVIKGV